MKHCTAQILFLSFVMVLASCSSFIRSITGDGSDESTSSSRAPASNGKSVTLDNGGATVLPSQSGLPEPSGPNLAANEFAAKAQLSSEKAARGYRRQADPWDGTGPFNEGSLWNPDGQDNFYFSKNLKHKLGDIVMVKLEPDVSDALNTKIASLLPRNSVNQVVADEAGRAAGENVASRVGTALGNANIGNAIGGAAANRVTASIEQKVKYLDVEEIPVRIIESLDRASFRVEGARRVNIRSAPYMLKITGIIRDEDIGANSTVATSKVFDSKMELTR